MKYFHLNCNYRPRQHVLSDAGVILHIPSNSIICWYHVIIFSFTELRQASENLMHTNCWCCYFCTNASYYIYHHQLMILWHHLDFFFLFQQAFTEAAKVSLVW